MSRIGKIARRTFLIGSAAVVGGVAFGYYMYKRDPKNPLLDDLGANQAALTPYVKIDATGITLITPRADKGQGAYSVQAALLAEELDVRLDQIRVDPGVPHPAYYNTALSHEAVPFLPTDDGMMAKTARGVADAAMKFIGMQITGGSTTVPDGYEKLRMAGAVARETLKRVVHDQTGIHMTRLRTQDGKVIAPVGTEYPYTTLAAQAAQTDLITSVELRDPSQWRILGKPMQRIDTVAKSTGTQTYGIDVELDGMLHAAVKINPYLGGALDGFDDAAARTMRGVIDVLPVTGGVAVVADNTWRAFQAVDAVDCQWGQSPLPAKMDGHWAAVEAAFVEEKRDSTNRDLGDCDAALAAGDVVQASYRAPYLVHAPLEPVNATVLVGDGRVDVWTGTQIPRFVQNNVAKIAGVEPDQVYVHVLMMGGSFGHRLEDDVVRQAAEIAVAHRGRPIKLTYTREEDVTHDYPRPLAMARAQGQISDGGIKTVDLQISSPSVMGSQLGRQGFPAAGPDAQIVAGAWEQPFAIENYRVRGYKPDLATPISSWRSVGASQNAFFHESFFDELCHAAGVDPVAERLRLCDHDDSRQVIQAVAEMANWGADLGPNRAQGIAFCMSFSVPVAEVVQISRTDQGIKLDAVFVAADVGKVLDPVNFENLVQGGVLWGLGHAIMGETTYTDGAMDQNNFDSFESLRLYQTPQVSVRGLELGARVRGIGEPPVPPAAPALANAIFALTGQRLREMPFNKFVDFA